MPIIDEGPDHGRRRARRRLKRGCCGCGCGLPTVLLVALMGLFLLRNRAPNIAIPSHAMPADNAYPDFVRAADMIGAMQHKAPASMRNPPTTREAFLAQTKACTAESAPGRALLKAAFGRLYVSPPVRSLSQVMLSPSARYREVARTYSGVAEYFELTGQPGKAADALLDCEEMAVTMPHGGNTIDELVGFACEAIALARFEPLLAEMSGSDLGSTVQRLSAIAKKRADFAEIAAETGYYDAALQQESFQDPRARTLSGQWKNLQYTLEMDEGRTSKATLIRDAASFALSDKASIVKDTLRCAEVAAAEAGKPYPSTLKINPADTKLADVMGSMNGVRAKHITMDSVLNILAIEAALYRYRIANRRFPASLGQLVPAFLTAVPKDPFVGPVKSEYRYKVTNAGGDFLLYGRGPDMVDHGGFSGRPGRDYGQPGFDIVAGSISRKGKLFP